MGAVLAAVGLGVAAVGAGASAYGTSQNASATRDQAKYNALLEKNFAQTWSAKANDYFDQKQAKLNDVGNIFNNMQSSGAFGSTDTLANLRKAQSDFSSLAAGDFTGFESSLRKTLSDSLVSTFGSGAPIGTYANLAADTALNFRQTGLNEAEKLTQQLSDLSNQQLGLEFGVMDQRYNTLFSLDRSRLTAVTGNLMQAAQTSGVATQAVGGALSSVGSSVASYGLTNAWMQSGQPMGSAYRNVVPSGYSASARPFIDSSGVLSAPTQSYSYPLNGPMVDSVMPAGYVPAITPTTLSSNAYAGVQWQPSNPYAAPPESMLPSWTQDTTVPTGSLLPSLGLSPVVSSAYQPFIPGQAANYGSAYAAPSWSSLTNVGSSILSR